MNRLEQELKNALRREQPPEGFADRVLARAAAESSERQSTGWRGWFAMAKFRWAAALAALLVMTTARVELHQRRQLQAEGEAAKQQVILAMRLTASQLRFAREKVRESTASLDGELTDRNGEEQ